jgi:hypothetical protein
VEPPSSARPDWRSVDDLIVRVFSEPDYRWAVPTLFRLRERFADSHDGGERRTPALAFHGRLIVSSERIFTTVYGFQVDTSQ